MDRDQFIEHAKAQLDRWNDDIKRLEEQATDGQAALRAQIAAFQAGRQEAEAHGDQPLANRPANHGRDEGQGEEKEAGFLR